MRIAQLSSENERTLPWLGKYFKASYEWPFLCTLSIKVAPAYSTYIDLAAKDYVATTQVSASILRESDWCVLLAGSTYSILFLRSNANSPKWIYTVGLWVVAKPPHSLLVLLLYTYLAYIALYIIPYVLLGSMYPLDDHKSWFFVQKKHAKHVFT